MEAKPEAFGEWCLLELMGHRRVAGFVREVTLAGCGLLRIDVFPGDADRAEITQFLPVGVLYCMTPITEQLARQFAQSHTVTPISRYELPAPVQAPIEQEGEHEDDRRERWE